MDKSLKSLLGLTDGGKRIFNIQDGEVSATEFEYCAVMQETMFGEQGYVDTLGPTWNMTLDPRFRTIENTFISQGKAVFGGDARQGMQTQLADGTFTSAITDLDPYSELLGEGRYFHGALIALAYDEAIRVSLPDLSFPAIVHAKQYSGTQREYREGLTHFKSLTADQQTQIIEKIKDYPALHPTNFHEAPDEFLWQLIHEHCPNYFARNGVANKTAQTLFRLFRADLLGLIDDYAELAKFNEWVKADGSGDLADRGVEASEEQPMVYGEVDMLEKALNYRAQLRTTAARVLNLIGVAGFIKMSKLELTELENDNLVRLIFRGDKQKDEEGFDVVVTQWPDGKAELSSRVLGYLQGIQVLRQSRAQREKHQLLKASGDSKRFICALKAGTVNAITRYTEPDLVISETNEELMLASILNDPIKQDLFLRFAQAEKEGDEEVVALLAPVFVTADYKVSEDTYYALVAEATALIRARAAARGIAAPEPGVHLGESTEVSVPEAKGSHPFKLSGPEILDIPDFTALAKESARTPEAWSAILAEMHTAADDFTGKDAVELRALTRGDAAPTLVNMMALARFLEILWWLEHENFAPRTFGRDKETGQRLYGEKRTAIRVVFDNVQPLSHEKLNALNGKNHSPAYREVGAINKQADPAAQ